MRSFVERKRLITAAISLLIVGVVGLVYAAWTTNGTGSGYAKASTAQSLTTSAVVPTATLYPGADGNVQVTINNPNSFPVRVSAIAGNGSVTAAGGIGSCTASQVTFTNQSGLTIDIAAAGSTTSTLTNAAHMASNADDGCQGATFTIPVAITGASNAP
jgi:hypothetical protein